MSYEAVQLKGGARTGQIRHAVAQREGWEYAALGPKTETMCGRTARIEGPGEDFTQVARFQQCTTCRNAVNAELERIKIETAGYEGLWVVFFGTRVEVIRADTSDAAREKWLTASYPYRGDEGDPARGRYSPPLDEQIAVRALTQKDVDLFTSWTPSFPARLKKMQKDKS